jgi:predicted Zn-dependent protease
VHGQAVDIRIDTSDISSVLHRNQIQKRLDWRRNSIRLDVPSTYQDFVQGMVAQWEYGFNRTTEACIRAEGTRQSPMRYVSRYNRGTPCAS